MADLVGKTLLNRYRIEESLGSGGMAEVYKAWDQQRATHLALKMMRQDLAEDRIFLRRFQREAQTLAQVQHPNIVRFYGIEKDDIHVFMLMEHIEGTTLQRVLFRSDGQPLNIDYIGLVMRSVCSALHYAHQMGLVHCDIKPANIMINESGNVLLTDFGIARMTDAATATMVGFGTPAYMAPELIRGDDPTPQSDIYSFGIVLYEMVTGGERPFTGESAQTTGTTSEKVRWEHLNLTPPSPRIFNPHLPPNLETVISCCLAKEPEQRYASTLELLNAVEMSLIAYDQGEIGQIPVPIFPESKDQPIPAGSARGASPYKSQSQQTPKPDTNIPPHKQIIAGVPLWMWGIGGILIILILILVIFSLGTDPNKIDEAIAQNNPGVRFPLAAVTEPMEEVYPTNPGVTLIQSPDPTNTVDIANESPAPTNNVVSATKSPSPTPTSAPEQNTKLPQPTAIPALNIGVSITRSTDNMPMMSVPAGAFIMGTSSDPDASAHEKPAYEVYLDAYWLDAYEVSNEMFATFVAETGYQTTAEEQGFSYMYDSNWKWTDVEDVDWRHPMGPGTGAEESLPVVHVSYYDAKAYCSWAGGRLPTEAEWEKAARGDDQRKYPWGSSFNASYLRFDSDIGPVSIYKYPEGQSPFGIYNLAGNVFEWTADFYAVNYYDISSRDNPDGPISGDLMVIRGGSWNNSAKNVRATHRDVSAPDYMNYLLGFRCAMDAD